ncbi:MAG TPA: hypothetical protein VFE25_09300 [Opitutaceae bacterium]|jgi:hypothetical protein|nr:hypothetical protein [Opitutaceae bacterium]
MEARMNRALRGLPNRKAPSGLEARVMAEISRRAALPWWRKSFAHWPSAIRVTFLGLSVVAATLLVAGVVRFGGSTNLRGFSGALENSRSWLFLGRDLMDSAKERASSLVASVPAIWLYAGIALVATSYATLAAFGAATYRVLTVERSTS